MNRPRLRLPHTDQAVSIRKKPDIPQQVAEAPVRPIPTDVPVAQSPVVSVVVPTVCRPTLRDTLDGLLAQTFTAWEAFVLSDGVSFPDWTYAYQSDPRLKFQVLGRSGMYGRMAWLTGFQAAQGRYFAICDDDDAFLPNKFSDQVTFLDTHPDVTLVYGRIRLRERERGAVYGTWFPVHNPQVMQHTAYLMNTSWLMRREAWEQVGTSLFDHPASDVAYWHNSDWTLYLRMIAAGMRFVADDKLVAEVEAPQPNVSHWAAGGFYAADAEG